MKTIEGYPDYMRESIKLVEEKREKNMSKPVKPLLLDDREKILNKYHPDYMQGTKRKIKVGPDKGMLLYNGIADLLEAKTIIDPFISSKKVYTLPFLWITSVPSTLPSARM